MKFTSIFCQAAMTLLVMLLTSVSAWAWSGQGTSTNPYQITNASDLAQLATDVNGGNRYNNKYFEQKANITASNTMATIGSTNNPFRGHYNGGGFTISGLTQPLFGSIQKGETGYLQYTLSEVQNLTISGAEISTSVTGGTMGILARAIYNNVSITNCHVVSSSLAITGGSNAKCGGLIGSVEDDQSSQPLATVSGCSVTATSITNNISGQYCGGLFGVLACRKNVDNNFVDATLTGDNKGGIAGYLSSTTDPSNYHDNYYHIVGVAAIPSQTDNGETAVYKVTAGNNTTIVNSTSTGVFTYNGNKYFPEGETVSMTLSNTATGAPLGYQYNSYTASAGTLSGNTTDGWTLTMPAADVLVSIDSPRSTGEAVAVSYIDENGIQQTAQAIALDGTETSIGTEYQTTWLFVNINLNYSNAVNIPQWAIVHLILCDGKTMNIGTSNSPVSDNDGIALGNNSAGMELTIYGQANGTGALNAYGSNYGICVSMYKQYGGRVTASGGNKCLFTSDTFTMTRGTLSATATGTGSSNYGIYANGDVNLNGGSVTATGSRDYRIYSNNGRTIFAGATVTASSYYAGKGVIVADGLTYSDGIHHYNGTLTSDERNAIADKTISPLVTGECGASGDNLTWTYDQVSKTLTISGTDAMADYLYYSQPWNNFQNDIQNIVIGNGVTSIGTEAFYECSSLESLTFASGSKLTTIGDKAFWGCNNTNFTTLDLPASVQSIGSYAFNNCSSLTTVTIGSGVTSIDRDAFYECQAVTDVYCYADPSALTWNENACDDFKPFKATRCHVYGGNEAADAWTSKFGSNVCVTFKGDLAPTATTSSVDGAYWGTYFNSAVNMKADAYTTVYKAAVDGSNVVLTAISDKVINAGQAVVLRRSTEGAVSLTPQTAASTADYSDNALHGVDVRTATNTIRTMLGDNGDGTFYVLGNTNSHFGFHKYTGEYMPANKAFLLLNGGSALTRSLNITWNDGDATGISTIETERETAQPQYYDLQGRKVAHPTKGLYILRGKKVIIK